jgi:hypothetical protein
MGRYHPNNTERTVGKAAIDRLKPRLRPEGDPPRCRPCLYADHAGCRGFSTTGRCGCRCAEGEAARRPLTRREETE